MTTGTAVQEQPIASPEQQEDTCRHHWIIESPHGATSWGQCKTCGARKEFLNSAGDFLWERDGASPFNRWGSVGSRRSGALSVEDEPYPVGVASDEDEGF